MVRLGFALAVLALGCSAAPREPSEPRRGALEVPRGTGGEASSTASAVTASEPPSNVPAVTLAPQSEPVNVTFERLETTPVVSFALGRPPKVAALARGEVLVFDGEKATRLAAADASQPDISAELFFGRDDQPRLMGSVRQPTGKSRPYYRRYRGGRFQPEPGELGPLAGMGALYGVLGHEDPEVVCSPGRFCLVKRVEGWGRAAAHAQPVRIVLGAGTAFALAAETVERLEGNAWVPLVPARTFEEPVSLSVDPTGATWIVEAKRDAVSRLANARWDTIAAPVRGARAIFANTAEDVWLVGNSGVAHYDGSTWRSLPGIPGPLAFVARSGSALWLAGEAGVFRSVTPKTD
jgi:hypothetical protein